MSAGREALFGPRQGTRMSTKANPGSIFSQKLDRAAFVAYLLGAVVPLIGMAVVVERFVLPGIEVRGDRFVGAGPGEIYVHDAARWPAKPSSQEEMILRLRAGDVFDVAEREIVD